MTKMLMTNFWEAFEVQSLNESHTHRMEWTSLKQFKQICWCFWENQPEKVSQEMTNLALDLSVSHKKSTAHDDSKQFVWLLWSACVNNPDASESEACWLLQQYFYLSVCSRFPMAPLLMCIRSIRLRISKSEPIHTTWLWPVFSWKSTRISP